MSSIYRTNNPLEYAEVDGIVIDERSPSPNIKGVGTGVALLVGQFQRGVHAKTQVTSAKDLFKKFGKSNYLGNIALKNKKFSTLFIVRVLPTGADKATLTVDAKVKFTAKSVGAYGNKLSVTVEAGGVSGKKYTIKDANEGASEYFPDEVYDNVAITGIVAAMAKSALVDVETLSTAAEPANQVLTSLANGDDGVLVDTDYEAAIAKAAVENSCNILFLDEYNAARNQLLKLHAGETNDKMVICSHEKDDSKEDIVADLKLTRNSWGRVLYAINWIMTTIDAVEVATSPASWMASILSQSAPYVDPASAKNTELMWGANGVYMKELTRQDYIDLMKEGGSTFEQDLDLTGTGVKPRSGVVNQVADTSRLTVVRRRMADYLINSFGKFLKLYQNDVNKKEKRDEVKGAYLSWDKGQVKDGILPSDKEVKDGKALLLDLESENDDDSIAEGKVYVLYKRRIFSSMRFIILKAEIGESVIVKEQ